jgi:hypothetical protein
MDAVYICRYGINEELRYSLRTVHNMKEVENVWVIGGKPSWYIGNYIPVPAAQKYIHAYNNFRALVKNKDISEEFILMNDDFYIIDEVEKLETFNDGLLSKKIKQYEGFLPNSKYTQRLKTTREILLEKLGREPLSFEVHIPMKMTKTGLKDALQYNALWRSYYGNVFNVETVETKDVKLYKLGARDPNQLNYKKHPSPFVSSEDASIMLVKNKFLQSFKTPSQYERKI